MIGHPSEQLFEEVAYIAYHFHWPRPDHRARASGAPALGRPRSPRSTGGSTSRPRLRRRRGRSARSDPYLAFIVPGRARRAGRRRLQRGHRAAAELEVHDYREGGVNEYVHRLPGPVRYPSNLTLRRGLTDAADALGLVAGDEPRRASSVATPRSCCSGGQRDVVRRWDVPRRLPRALDRAGAARRRAGSGARGARARPPGHRRRAVSALDRRLAARLGRGSRDGGWRRGCACVPRRRRLPAAPAPTLGRHLPDDAPPARLPLVAGRLAAHRPAGRDGRAPAVVEGRQIGAGEESAAFARASVHDDVAATPFDAGPAAHCRGAERRAAARRWRARSSCVATPRTGT